MTFGDLAWLIPTIAIGIAMLVAMIMKPRVWLYIVFLTLPYFLADSGIGMSASEVIVGAFIVLSVCLWMIMKLSAGAKLFRWWGDFLLVGFLVLSVTNVAIALLNGVPFIDWLSEWSIFFLMLYYFPLREYYGNNEEELKQLLIMVAISTVLMAGYSFWMYKMRAAEGGMIYAYQLLSSRSRLYGPVFVYGIVFGTAAIFHVKKNLTKFVLFLFILVNLAGLVQSFTRSLWVVTAGCLIVLTFFLRPKQNIAFAIGTALFILAVYSTAMWYNPRITTLAIRIAESRITTSTQFKGGDYSFETRLIEAEAAQRWVKEYPMSGMGLRAKKVNWNPINQEHWNNSFIHIGYLSLPFKFGLPMAILYLVVLGLFSWRGIKSMLITRSWRGPSMIRATAIGNACFLPALYITLSVAGFIDTRYGNAMLAIVFAFSAISYDLAVSKQKSQAEIES